MSVVKIKVIKEGTGDTKPNSLLNDEVEINYSMFISKTKTINKKNENKNDYLNELSNSIENSQILNLKEDFSDFLLIEEKLNFRFDVSNENNLVNNGLLNSVNQMLKNEVSWFASLNKDNESSNDLLAVNFLLENNESSNNFETILYRIEMINFSPRIKSRYEMTLEEKINFATQSKKDGIEKFKEKKFIDACNLFEEASSYLLTENNLSRVEDKELLISLMLNTANCYNNLSRYESTLIKCEYIINTLTKTNPKAYYYRAIAYLNLGSDEHISFSEKDIEKLQELLSLDDPIIKNLKTQVENKKQYIAESRKNMYKSIFAKNKGNIYDEKKLPLKKEIPKEINPYNPKVFFDISVGEQNEKIERVEFELFADVVPKTTENFLLLASTKKYKDTIFHRIVKDFMLQGGDFENFNGSGGKSIYGKKFEDENFTYNHSEECLLSMANSGPNTNGSQFFITFKKTEWLDGRHVVFGRVIKNKEFIMSLNEIEAGQDERPIKVIKIVDCDRIPLTENK